MVIETERMVIYPLTWEELDEYVSGRMIMQGEFETEKKVREYTVEPMRKADKKDYLYYTFWIGEYEGEKAVEIGFHRPPNQEKIIEIWCHVREDLRGKGLGTEAIIALTGWANEQSGVDYVAASVEPTNEASKKMMLKSGYDHYGQMKGMEIYFANLIKE